MSTSHKIHSFDCTAGRSKATREYKPLPAFTEQQRERFWSKVDRRGPLECWLWKGGVTRTKWGAVYGLWMEFRPHRVAYTLLVGPIPAGHTLDHLRESGVCSSTLCVNPAHLEAVTQSENTKRYRRAAFTGFCKWGHPRGFDEKCLGCSRRNAQLYRERHSDYRRPHVPTPA